MEGGASSFNTKPTFFSHVFSTTEESKAEVVNVLQYILLAIVPIVALNKLIQRFVPEADLDKSSLELLIEIMLQLAVIFCGIIVIHRIITYIPTYSGFRYEALSLTNAILPFLVIILSIQSKLGLKVNILYDRLLELWNGESDDDDDDQHRRKRKHGGRDRRSQQQQPKVMNLTQHVPSQADSYDENHTPSFPPPPMMTSSASSRSGNGGGYDDTSSYMMPSGPLPANGILGGAFGSFF